MDWTWSGFAGFNKITSPGLVFASVLLKRPARKSACVVSVKQFPPAIGTASFCKANVVVPAPGTVAFIPYEPGVPLAVNVGATATPRAFVVDTANLLEVLGKEAPAPPTFGFTVHVTVIPLIAGFTVTVGGITNGWFKAAF
jgi:hypothetical protein